MAAARITRRERYTAVQLAGALGGEIPEETRAALTGLVTESRNTVVQLAGAGEAPKAWRELLTWVGAELRAAGKGFRIVRYAGNALDADWLAPDLSTALESFDNGGRKIAQVHFIRTFVGATTRVFYMRARSRCALGPIQIKPEPSDAPTGDLSGVIDVQGSSLSYRVVLTFPEPTFLKYVSRTQGVDHAAIGRENIQAAGELMRQVFEQARLLLDFRKAGIEPATPRIVLGKAIPATPADAGGWGKKVLAAFESELGSFYVEIWLPPDFEPSQLRSTRPERE
jgi:hypothetical protein